LQSLQFLPPSVAEGIIVRIMPKRPPQSLYKDVVQSPATAVHADGNLSPFQPTSELPAGKVRSLVAVEILRARDL
jgi:hypothetical protein